MLKLMLTLAVAGAAADPLWDIGIDNKYSCTGKVRVCRDDESPTDSAGNKVCNPNVMNRPTVYIDGQNWPSALQNAWQMQIVMMELMQVPVEMNDQRPHEGNPVDFYNPGTTQSRLHQYGWEGHGYPFDAIAQADKDPFCKETKDGKLKSCAHIMSEIWTGKAGVLHKGVVVDKNMASPSALGVAGRLGYFVQKWVADAYGGITYRQINTPSIAADFGQPKRFAEHCAEQKASMTPAAFATKFCGFWDSHWDATWKTEVSKANHGFMLKKADLNATMLAAATAAGVTDIPAATTTLHIWAGALKPIASGRAHFMEAPCTWTVFWPVQAPSIMAEHVHYSYGELLALWEVMAYNLDLVDRTVDKTLWRNDPHWYPLIGWWWKPDSLLIKYKYAGESWELESVFLKPWNGECEAARQNVFVPKYKDATPASGGICDPNSGHFNFTLNPDWYTECGADCVTAGCDFPEDLPKIGTSASLQKLNPDVYSMLTRFTVDSSEQLARLGLDDFAKTAFTPQKTTAAGNDYASVRSRDIVCQNIRQNIATMATWQPDPHSNTGCRVTSDQPLCSGHGNCAAAADSSMPGSCACADGWTGAICDAVDTGKLAPAMYNHSNVDSQGVAVLDFKWGVLASEACSGGSKCSSTLADYADGGYRLSRATQTTKKMNVFQPSAGLGALGIALGATGIVVSIVFMAWTMALKNKPVIMFSQPTFLLTVLVGAMFEFASIMMLSNNVMSSALCYASTWTGHLGFAIAFSALFAKTWRLNKLFNNKKMRKMRITNKDVFKIVAGIALVSVAILIAWTAMGASDPAASQEAYGKIYERANTFDIYVGCNSQSGSAPIFILLGFEGLLLLYGAMLAYNGRNISVSFSESKWIAIVIYNIFIIGIVAVVISFVGPGSIDPDGLFIVQVICQFVGTLMAICILFLPKLMHPDQQAGNTTTSGTAGTASTSTPSSPGPGTEVVPVKSKSGGAV